MSTDPEGTQYWVTVLGREFQVPTKRRQKFIARWCLRLTGHSSTATMHPDPVERAQ